jgi:hypothetical protein
MPNPQSRSSRRWIGSRSSISLLLLSAAVLPFAVSFAQSEDPKSPAADKVESAPEPTKELFTGKVVLATEALKRKGLTAAEEMKGQVVLETPDGELIPILADWRGRAFYQDERLRDRKVELVGYRRKGLPYLQALMVFTFNDAGEREYTDYWCDVCSIPMYEIKPCECCQGEIRLRFQKQNLPDYLKTASDAKSSQSAKP